MATEQMEKHFMDVMKMLPKECLPGAMKMLEHMKECFTGNAMPNEYQGYQLHPCFEPETAKFAYEKLQLNKGDVVVATYPKTGTTWMLAIVQHILHVNNPEELQKYVKLRQFVGYLEFNHVSKYDVWKKLSFPQQVFGTHLPAPLVNLKRYREMGVKVIYVIRNPKDQLVSWRNFVMKFPYAKFDFWKSRMPENETEFYKKYLEGKQYAFAKEGEGYLESLLEWYKHKDDDNILFIVFEELKRNPHKEIKKIAEFIGKSLTDKELDLIVDKTSFTSMKKEYGNFDSEKGVTMFRKGEIGDWKNHLTVAQSEMIDRKVEKILGDTDIKFICE